MKESNLEILNLKSQVNELNTNQITDYSKTND